MAVFKAFALAALIVSTLVMVSESRVARKDLGLDLGGIGLGIGAGVGIGLGGSGSGSGAGAGAGSGSSSGSSSHSSSSSSSSSNSGSSGAIKINSNSIIDCADQIDVGEGTEDVVVVVMIREKAWGRKREIAVCLKSVEYGGLASVVEMKEAEEVMVAIKGEGKSGVAAALGL
ncbi:hypothetical protein LguiA_011051 [Lonicera macranthoides]